MTFIGIFESNFTRTTPTNITVPHHYFAFMASPISSCGVDIQLSVGHGFINILDTVLPDAASLWGHVFKRLVFNHLVGIDAEHEFLMRGLAESILGKTT
jgi:hypothetical protein